MKLLFALLFVYFSFFTLAYAQPNYRLKRLLVEKHFPTNNQYNKWDSTEYYYSPGEGGTIKNEVFYYGGSGREPYAPGFTIYNSEHMQFHTGMRYDSAVCFHYGNGYRPLSQNKQQFANNTTFLVTYNNTSLSTQPVWNLGGKNEYNYSNDSIIRHISCQNNQCDTFDYLYVYNSNGMLDSMIRWYRSSLMETFAYSYINNLLTESRYYANNYKSKTIYTYASNLLISSTGLVYNSSTANWDSVGTTLYSYNSNNLLTHKETWYTQGKTGFTTDYSYDNNGRKVEDILYRDYIWAASTPALKWVRKRYGYHSSGAINLYQVNHWDDSTQSWGPGADSIFGPSHNVYLDYELYWPAGVSDVVKETDKITIYPSPAAGLITVQIPDMQPGPVNMSINNMNGQTMRQWKDKVGREGYSRTIPVQELPAGMYILKVNGENTTVSKQFNIIR